CSRRPALRLPRCFWSPPPLGWADLGIWPIPFLVVLARSHTNATVCLPPRDRFVIKGLDTALTLYVVLTDKETIMTAALFETTPSAPPVRAIGRPAAAVRSLMQIWELESVVEEDENESELMVMLSGMVGSHATALDAE